MKKISRTISLVLIILLSTAIQAQQTVNSEALDKSYSGGYYRTNIGIALGNISFSTLSNGRSFSAFNFHFEPGKRLNQKIAVYGYFSGNVLAADDTQLNEFVQSSLGVGTHLYLMNPNTYITPELGFSLGSIDDTVNDYICLGAAFSIKMGHDLYIGKNRFLGLQAFYTLFNGSEKESGNKLSGAFMGASLSLKLGK